MCIQITFLNVIQKARLDIIKYRCEAVGELESMIGNIFKFSRITLQPQIEVKGSTKERIIKLLEIAKKNCIISNSVKCKIELKPKIIVEES